MSGRTQLVLASKSPARYTTLRNAGVDPIVIVSDVNEDEVAAALPSDATEEALVCTLAQAKAQAVAHDLLGHLRNPDGKMSALTKAGGSDGTDGSPVLRYLVLGCDSMLHIDGRMVGKPYTAEVAKERIRQMRGKDATLWTGHALVVVEREEADALAHKEDDWRIGDTLVEAASTTVHFGDIDDTEIDAYVATGEPLNVAGSFTIDGLGGPFVRGITGDPHSVVGVSLPLLRDLVRQAGTFWPDLWHNQS